jgi:hypothetical protein
VAAVDEMKEAAFREHGVVEVEAGELNLARF